MHKGENMKRIISISLSLVIVALLLTPLMVSASSPMRIYSDPNPESSAVDGIVYLTSSDTSWNNLVTASTGIAHDNFDASPLFGIYSGSTPNTWTYLFRSYFLFDTSMIPSDATITAATLSIYTYSKMDDLGITPSINVYSSNPASNTALIGDDYAQTGSTPFATAISWSNIAEGGDTVFTLNSTGIAAIDKSGVSKFSIKTNYDATNTAPTTSVYNDVTEVGCYFSEAGIDGMDVNYTPYLTITYTTGGTTTTTTTTTPPGSFGVSSLPTSTNSLLRGQLTGLGSGTTSVFFQYGYAANDLSHSTPSAVLNAPNNTFEFNLIGQPDFSSVNTVYYRAAAVDSTNTTVYGSTMQVNSPYPGVNPIASIVPILILAGFLTASVFIFFKGGKDGQSLGLSAIVLTFGVICFGMVLVFLDHMLGR